MKTILFRMKEEIINGINYRLNGWTKTAEVIKKSEGYKGDVIIPETVVFNERSYRVTSIGIVMAVREKHPKKAPFPILVTR